MENRLATARGGIVAISPLHAGSATSITGRRIIPGGSEGVDDVGRGEPEHGRRLVADLTFLLTVFNAPRRLARNPGVPGDTQWTKGPHSA